MEFETSLREKNLKITPQRLAILREIKANGHIGIEEIYENIIKKDCPSISLATVYKNITALNDANILREVKAPSQKQKYELSCDRHIHVSCEKCGKLQDVYVNVQNISTECMHKTGYKLFDVSAVFIGLCPECSSKSQELKQKNQN